MMELKKSDNSQYVVILALLYSHYAHRKIFSVNPVLLTIFAGISTLKY
jgi:hypothetical protein